MTARISLRDEADLTWYFLHGEGKFQRSTQGAMTAKLERDSAGSTHCRVCDGSGILESEAAVARHRAKWRHRTDDRRSVAVWKATGVWVDRKTLSDPATYAMVKDDIETRQIGQVIGAECQVCSGTGWVPSKLERPRCPECWGNGKLARAQCRTCLGTGVPGIDAQPVRKPIEDGGVDVDSGVLRKVARVTRRLRLVGPAHAAILERYYGIHGQSWASHPGGRLRALEEFTEAGQKLIRKTRAKGDEATGASMAERITAQEDLQARDPQLWRRELLDKALEQAGELHRRATEAWVKTAEVSDWGYGLGDLYDEVTATGDAYEAWLDRNWEEPWFDSCDEQGVE